MLISPSLKLSEAAIALLYVPPSLFDIIRYKFNDSCCISYTNLYIWIQIIHDLYLQFTLFNSIRNI